MFHSVGWGMCSWCRILSSTQDFHFIKKILNSSYVKSKHFKTYSAEFVANFFLWVRKEIVLTILYKNQQSFFLQVLELAQELSIASSTWALKNKVAGITEEWSHFSGLFCHPRQAKLTLTMIQWNALILASDK